MRRVFAFVVPVGDPERYAELARPGIELAREPDSVVVAVDGGDRPALRVNAALDELAPLPDLEGVVILHEDLVIQDPGALAVLRETLRDPRVAIAGLIGATGAVGLSWWDGEAAGRLGTPHAPGGAVAALREGGDVAAVDGSFLALGPWAVRTLRFDAEQAADFHGYDVDLCARARHHGRRVVVVPIAAHHEHRPVFGDADRWARAEVRYRARWELHRPVSLALHAELTSSAVRGPAADG